MVSKRHRDMDRSRVLASSYCISIRWTLGVADCFKWQLKAPRVVRKI